MKAIITVGISASGKSTYAQELVQQGWVEANRDWIRFNVVCPGADWSTYKFTKKRENDVTSEQEVIVLSAAEDGKNVIISDTNLNSKTRNKWVEFLKDLGYSVEVMPFPVTLEEAWKRDTARPNGVGRDVIYKQWKQWLDFVGRRTYTPDTSQPKAVIVDVDGTLAAMSSRSPFDWERVGEDGLSEVVADMVDGLNWSGYQIIIVSGRDGICYDETEHWLTRNGVSFDALFMRQPDDFRKDTVVKEEIFWDHIAENWNVVAVIDDRPSVVRMWNDLGIQNVIAVADQNVEF